MDAISTEQYYRCMDDARLARWRKPGPTRIIDAAERRFAVDSYAGARIDAIAAEAGVSKSHLYYHFDGKPALLEALVAVRTADMLLAKERVIEALDDVAQERSEGYYRALIDHAVDEVLRPHRAFIRIMLVEAIRSPDALQPTLAAIAHAVDDSAAHLGVGQHGRASSVWREAAFPMLILPTLWLIANEPPDAHGQLPIAAALARLQSMLLEGE